MENGPNTKNSASNFPSRIITNESKGNQCYYEIKINWGVIVTYDNMNYFQITNINTFGD